MVPYSCRSSRFMLALVLLGAALAVWAASVRVMLESQSLSVEWLMDYQAIRDSAMARGVPLDDLLRQYRKLGVSAVAVDEESRDSLQASGRARLLSFFELEDLQAQGQISAAVRPRPECVYFVARDVAVAKRIRAGAGLSLGYERVRLWPDDASRVVEIRADMRTLSTLGLGVPVELVKDLHQRFGYAVWVRPWNCPGVTGARVQAAVRRVGAIPGVQGMLFGGARNEALGYPDHLEEMVAAVRETRLMVGYIELSPAVQLKGMQSVARMLQDRVVRVMAVPPAQQARMDPEAVASMYSLGARERNIRLLYVRPYNDGVDEISLTEANSMLFSGIKAGLGSRLSTTPSLFGQGLRVRGGLSLWTCIWCVIAMSVGAAFCLLVRRIAPWNGRWWMTVVGGLGAVALAACLSGVGLRELRLLLALGALTVLPIWGLVGLLPRFEVSENCSSFRQAFRHGWQALAVASLFSLVGGLYAVALLPDTTYLLSIDVFRGVKLHGVLVPLAVMLVWIAQQQKRGGLQGFVRILNRNVRVWHLLVFLLLSALAVLYLVRTGNSGGDMVVSEGERALRRWLDNSLGVRPRFKEFLLGNPALLLLPVLALLRWRGLVPFALLAAAVGMASLSDTYAHIHTPLCISLWRSLLGVAVGGAIGSLVALVCYCLKKMYLRSSAALDEVE